jgi:prophage tail gpP-like protein
MERNVYNPQKGRIETVDVEFTNNNTTWFRNYKNARDISMITDFDGDLLIGEFGYTYPLRIYGLSRADIGYDQRKARRLKRRNE